MRGKVMMSKNEDYPLGITPAYAGKSLQSIRQQISSRDHPRVCGEKPEGLVVMELLLGSPPRMRGKEHVGFTGAKV